MPGIWTIFLFVALYGVISGQVQIINNRIAGRKDDDPAGTPGCLSVLLYSIGISILGVLISLGLEKLF